MIADFADSRVRVVAVRAGTFYGQPMRAGDIYTIAGAGTAGLGDGGLAVQARLSAPTGIAITPSGAVLVAAPGRMRLISS